jgi:predicted RNase H-like HicB family nuclease
MTLYVAILEKEHGSLWGVWFPDCPGCVTAAESMQAAVAQAVAALRLWAEGAAAEGDALPEPRSLDALREDPDVREALQRGDAAIVVPLLQDKGRTGRANVSLDAGLLEAIDEAARARGLTRSSFLASAAKEKIGALQ